MYHSSIEFILLFINELSASRSRDHFYENGIKVNKGEGTCLS